MERLYDLESVNKGHVEAVGRGDDGRARELVLLDVEDRTVTRDGSDRVSLLVISIGDSRRLGGHGSEN